VVWAMVDTQNTVSEINENNNTGHVGMAVMLPDLDVLKVTVPTSNVTINQPITISATVQNTGAVDVIGAFEIDLYQNLASAPGAQVGDVNCNVNSLAALATTTCTGTVTYATAGSYTVWAQADTMNTVAESNETNNTGHVGLTVALPDLMLTRVTATPSTGTAPQVVTITATIKNASGVDAIVPFNVDLYQNLASAPGVSDVGDATCTVDGLAATASTTCSATVTYETAGTYQVWGQVDTMNAVTETDESNNVTKGPSVRLH
jgi:subtilase family serine protease